MKRLRRNAYYVLRPLNQFYHGHRNELEKEIMARLETLNVFENGEYNSEFQFRRYYHYRSEFRSFAAIIGHEELLRDLRKTGIANLDSDSPEAASLIQADEIAVLSWNDPAKAVDLYLDPQHRPAFHLHPWEIATDVFNFQGMLTEPRMIAFFHEYENGQWIPYLRKRMKEYE